MSTGQTTTGDGFVLAADEGQAFWFLNTLTINKVGDQDTQGRLSIVDHRVPAGFASPPHLHRSADEVLYILQGQFEGFCGERAWQASSGSLVFLPRAVPHGFRASDIEPGRTLVILTPGGFDRFVADLGEPAEQLVLPDPVLPNPAHVVEVAAAHGIDILSPP